ncbi:MAG: hypothetical protein AB7I79_21785 [Rhizobiaceae bacterium]
MTTEPKTTRSRAPDLTPDGRARRARGNGEPTRRGDVDEAHDPLISGDGGQKGYANTDEAAPDGDGLVRRSDEGDRPIT